MKQKSNTTPDSLLRTTLTVFLSLLLLGTSAFAANYSNSLSLPPAGNPPSLIDSSLTYQEKKGGFWADAIGATDGFCIGNSCITEWPWVGQPATCQYDVMIKQGQVPGGSTPVGSGCTLSSAEVAAGWIVQSWDLCSWVHSADCAGWKYCTYSRLSCTGSVVVTPGTLYRASPYTPAYSQGYYDGGGGCFSPETLVTMADGTQKNIVDVKFGDRVLSADEVTGQLNVSTVTKVWKHTGEYKTLRINDIVVTPEHRFKVQRNGVESWLHARDIHVGDSLITTQGIISVTSVSANEPLSQVYNLTTVPSHTYFAGGVLVHNVKNNNGDIPQLINDL
jgi:hypothetical protein